MVQVLWNDDEMSGEPDAEDIPALENVPKCQDVPASPAVPIMNRAEPPVMLQQANKWWHVSCISLLGC